MNYLQLCQLTRELAGIPGTGPSSVVGLLGELRRLSGWVSQAWVEVQNQREDWAWMRKSCAFDTVAQQQEYEVDEDIGLLDFGHWKPNSFTIHRKSSGRSDEMRLGHQLYDEFEDYYLMGSRLTTYSRPTDIAITPQRNLVLGLPPDDVYVVRGDYYKDAQVLALDADVPDLPPRFHMIIVHKAMLKYGTFTAAPEVLQEHDALYRILYNKLQHDQAPQIMCGGSLM